MKCCSSGHKIAIHLNSLDETEEKMADFTYLFTLITCTCLHMHLHHIQWILFYKNKHFMWNYRSGIT